MNIEQFIDILCANEVNMIKIWPIHSVHQNYIRQLFS